MLQPREVRNGSARSPCSSPAVRREEAWPPLRTSWRKHCVRGFRYLCPGSRPDRNPQAQVQTTEIYARVSRKQKDEAIANAYRDVGIKNPEPKLWEKDDELLDFLSNLCSKR